MSLRKKINGTNETYISRFDSGSMLGSWRVMTKVEGLWTRVGVYKSKTKAEKVAITYAKPPTLFDHSAKRWSDEQKSHALEFINSGVSIDEVREIVNKAKLYRESTVELVTSEWLAERIRTGNYSTRYIGDLRFVKVNLTNKIRSDKSFGSITTYDLNQWIESFQFKAKRQKNVRGVLVNLWKWAMIKEYTAKNYAALLEAPREVLKTGGHDVLIPSQFATLLANVRQEFLPWLAISGFAGLRASEVCGAEGAEENRLRWSDFDWKERRISIRPETSKTRLHRYTPICDALAEWLEPYRMDDGYVHTTVAPSYFSKKGQLSETKRLGELVGGWKSNCLRASRASYRLAQTNSLDLTAMEGGHSITMLKRNYLNPRFKKDADSWFNLTPRKVREIVV